MHLGRTACQGPGGAAAGAGVGGGGWRVPEARPAPPTPPAWGTWPPRRERVGNRRGRARWPATLSPDPLDPARHFPGRRRTRTSAAGVCMKPLVGSPRGLQRHLRPGMRCLEAVTGLSGSLADKPGPCLLMLLKWTIYLHLRVCEDERTVLASTPRLSLSTRFFKSEERFQTVHIGRADSRFDLK